MSMFRSGITALLALVLASCATTDAGKVPVDDIVVQHEMTPTLTMSAYRTYTWLAPKVLLNDPAGNWDKGLGRDIDPEVKLVVNRIMRDRGMTESDSGGDLQVSYGAGLDASSVAVKLNPETDKTEWSSLPAGAIVVALIDSATGKAIWIGQAHGDVAVNLPIEQKRARVEYALEQMFKLLPP